MSALALEKYLGDALASDNASMGTIMMGEIYLILIDQGSSRQEFLDACLDSGSAKTAFTTRLIQKSGFAESIVKVALHTVITTPSIRDLFRDCIKELRAKKGR